MKISFRADRDRPAAGPAAAATKPSHDPSAAGSVLTAAPVP
ncbi:hypothetical protein [Streptomyces decoyicus]